MRCRQLALLSLVLVLAPVAALAQDFGVMESAETIDRGNVKLRANPMVVFGEGDLDDNEIGVAIMAGYGFTDMFDLEGGAAFYDGVAFVGANAEFWLLKRKPLDFSVIAGLHFARGDQTVDTTGIDLTLLASKHVTPRLDLYGALDFAFESITKPDIDDGFTRIHFVPGVEYRLHPNLDLLAEVGIALDDDASHYVSGGVAFYFR